MTRRAEWDARTALSANQGDEQLVFVGEILDAGVAWGNAPALQLGNEPFDVFRGTDNLLVVDGNPALWVLLEQFLAMFLQAEGIRPVAL